jgi:DNA-binding FadR family transcriptional regulator
VRRALELAFLPAAIAGLNDAQLDELDEHVRRMRDEAAAHRSGRSTWTSTDAVRRVDNRILQELLTTFWRLFLGVEQGGGLPPGNQEQTVALHAAIVAAVRERDVASAKEVMDEHFRDVERRLGRAPR